ncbi:unnamed protein product, partial [Nesidiocoris tenuis]
MAGSHRLVLSSDGRHEEGVWRFFAIKYFNDSVFLKPKGLKIQKQRAASDRKKRKKSAVILYPGSDPRK